MTVRGGIARLVVLAFAVAACSAPRPADPPTVDEARAFLDQIVRFARARDFDAMCATAGDGNCARKLAEAGADRVPADPPTIRAGRVVPTTTAGDQVSLGGIVLVVCGIDALGDAYESEMLVFRDSDMTLRAINPVYWGTARIASGGRTVIPPAPEGAC